MQMQNMMQMMQQGMNPKKSGVDGSLDDYMKGQQQMQNQMQTMQQMMMDPRNG